jgi:hypothetical protein
MAEFESYWSYHEFSLFVRFKARHILDEANQRFLATVLETSGKRRNTIQKGEMLWRTQLGHEAQSERIDVPGGGYTLLNVDEPFNFERMMPLPDRASEGRVNAKGIPSLYLSTDMKTAMSEVRPWIGSYVSVAKFTTLRDLLLIDCSRDPRQSVAYFEEPAPIEREKYVWGMINENLSSPVSRSDDVADYAPTQVLAETFRNHGYDGIIYQSSLGVGRNVAIFDLTSAEPINCYLYQTASVTFGFSLDMQLDADQDPPHTL